MSGPATVALAREVPTAPALDEPPAADLPQEIRHLRRPPADPRHCKPWVDAMSLGWYLAFAYEGTLEVRPAPHCNASAAWTGAGRGPRAVPVSSFARGYFGLATGYTFRTPPGIALLVTSLPLGVRRRDGLHPVPGVIETDWYPKPLFIVFETPTSKPLRFTWGEPVAWLVPVPAERHVVQELDERGRAQLAGERDDYDQYLREHGELRWTSVEGHGFSRQYRLFSRRARRRNGGEARAT